MNVRYDHVTVFVARPIAAGSYEFLQLRRRADDHLGGTWQTVRGSMEAGESAWQTAVRELREETGLAPDIFYSTGIVETFFIASMDTLWHSPTFLVIVSADAQIILDAEHDAFRWIDASVIESAAMWLSEKPLLRLIIENLLMDSPSKKWLQLP